MQEAPVEIYTNAILYANREEVMAQFQTKTKRIS